MTNTTPKRRGVAYIPDVVWYAEENLRKINAQTSKIPHRKNALLNSGRRRIQTWNANPRWASAGPSQSSSNWNMKPGIEIEALKFEIGPGQSGIHLNREEKIGQRMRRSSGNFVSKRVRWTRLDLNPLSKWIILKVETLWNAHQTTQATLNMLPYRSHVR